MFEILDTDSYKTSHFLQYPQGMTGMFSYMESRGGSYSKTLVFGLQYVLKRYFTQKVTQENVHLAARACAAHGVPFPREAWLRIAIEHKGNLPVSIKAVPEGTLVPTHNILMSVESTDPQIPWLGGWLETQLLRTWYPTTVATRSHFIKQIIRKYLLETSDNLTELPFKLHDFGSRGVSSRESAMIGGMAHLVNFMGTDTMVALDGAMKYYGCEMAGFSIPAAEHSTITSWGKDHEVDAYKNMLTQFAKPNAILAVVSDSYDLWNAVDVLWGQVLKQEVVDSGATVVIRPDSGDPLKVVLKTIGLLENRFGCDVNSKGFKVLRNVRIIQGDGVDEVTIEKILSGLKILGFSASNIAFGMGGALLQKLDRDTQKFAIKCSAVEVNGVWRDVFKDPITDPGKASKKGRLTLIRSKLTGEYMTVPVSDKPISREFDEKLVEVFKNGELLQDWTLNEIRARSEES